jgi:hypothetical protein
MIVVVITSDGAPIRYYYNASFDIYFDVDTDKMCIKVNNDKYAIASPDSTLVDLKYTPTTHQGLVLRYASNKSEDGVKLESNTSLSNIVRLVDFKKAALSMKTKKVEE